MVLESIADYWIQSFTFKLFLGMLLYRIADNIGFDIVPTWFPYFAEIGAKKENMSRIYKEIGWAILMINLLIIVAYALKVKI